jgi:hypothetical protein
MASSLGPGDAPLNSAAAHSMWAQAAEVLHQRQRAAVEAAQFQHPARAAVTQLLPPAAVLVLAVEAAARQLKR